ncbi:MAG: hypothetical protein M3T49_03185 [Candidatus Eremiobacteraeota bacterium]|nr:hypothetical protein [Candidatus Eremiobacteraeota bacterium]
MKRFSYWERDGEGRKEYRTGDLRSYAKWLEYSGCPYARDAVTTAAHKRLNLNRVIGAWETRLHAREGLIRSTDLHELDEFDSIVEELKIWHARNQANG